MNASSTDYVIECRGRICQLSREDAGALDREEIETGCTRDCDR